mgnify:CR=1 FL=1
MPGHIFPLMAQQGGVLSRAGHTEAGCDIALLSGQTPAAVIVEIMNNDGTMARRPDLEAFAQEHDIKIGTIADLIHYRLANEKTVEIVNDGQINTDYGMFRLVTFKDSTAGNIHLALVAGDIKADEPTLARVQSGSSMRDLFCAQPPGGDAGWNIRRCLERVASAGKGVIVLLADNESDDDILHGVDIALGKQPKPRPEVGQTTYFTVGVGSQILRDVGVGKMRLMGAPVKSNAISGFDLEVVEYEPVDRQQ